MILFIRAHWRWLTLGLLVAISVLSLWPLDSLPAVPGSDKTHHLIAYAALMFPAALHRARYWSGLALLFVSYSGLIELLQPYVNRHGEWLDLAANTAGVACGLLAGALLRRFYPQAA